MSIRDYIKGKGSAKGKRKNIGDAHEQSNTLEFVQKIIATGLVEYAPTSRFEVIVEDIVEAYFNVGKKMVLLVTPATRAAAYLERFQDHISKKKVRLVKVSASTRTDHFYSVNGGKKKADAYKTMTEISVDWLEYLTEIIEGLDDKCAMVFEPVSDVVLINGFEKSFKFIKKTVDYCAERGIYLTCFMNADAHTETIRASFEGLFTNIAGVENGILRILK